MRSPIVSPTAPQPEGRAAPGRSARGAASRRRSRLPLLLLAALLPLCLAAKVSRIVPPAAAPPLSVEGNRVSLLVGPIEVRLEVLQGPARLHFLREHRAAGQDLFADPPGGRTTFTTFRLDIVNASRDEVNLNPAGLRAVVDNIPYFPLEYTSAYEYLVSRRRLDPKVVEDLKRAAFLEVVVVPPGRVASGLVVFQDLPERFKRVNILCDSILVGTEARSFVVPFGVVQEKARGRGPGGGG